MYRDYVRSLLGPHVRFGFLVSIDQEYKDDVWQQTFSHGKDGKQLFFIETDSESEEWTYLNLTYPWVSLTTRAYHVDRL